MPLIPTRYRLLLHRRHERSPAVRQIRRVVADRLGHEVDVLEIGCGYGENGAQCLGDYVGVDIDPEAVAVARRQTPGRRFFTWDVVRDGDVPGAPFHTVLLCMTVHELGARREAVLARSAEMASERLLIVDYDPGLGGLLRLYESALEKGRLGGYLRFDLAGFLASVGWRLGTTERIGERHCCWEYERCP